MEREVYNLGDGIQNLIVLTYPLFTNRGKPLLVFIEEPELYLHPGYQRKLIDVLTNPQIIDDYQLNLRQYFMVTHSNHLIDLCVATEQLTVFKVKREFNLDTMHGEETIPGFSVQNVNRDDKSILKELGILNSSVFLSNCTIWVEGITDRLYLSHYFNIYQEYLLKSGKVQQEQVFIEDLHYSFLEYGGSNITHWSFLASDDVSMDYNRLCRSILLVTDKDTNKEQRHQELSDNLGCNYHCWKSKEIENVIKDSVLKKTIATLENSPDLIDSLQFNGSSYKNKPMGTFIFQSIQDLGRKPKRKYAADSGTIADKRKFCKTVIEQTNDYSDLSAEVQNFCKKMYQFVIQNNE